MPPVRVTILGSGSRGNSSVLSIGGRRILIDAGFSPRQTRLRMESCDLTGPDEPCGLESIDGILLTHVDRDHFHPGWIAAANRMGIPVYLHRRHRHRPTRDGLRGHVIELFDEEHFDMLSRDVATPHAIRIEPVLCAHDGTGCCAFVMNVGGVRLGWATDVGNVPDMLLRRFTDLDGLAIESNYDPDLQWASDRPTFLKQRITGGSGHLSNDEAMAAVSMIARSSHLQSIALLHRSQQCNSEECIESAVDSAIPHLRSRVVIATQDTPCETLQFHPPKHARAVKYDDTPATLFG